MNAATTVAERNFINHSRHFGVDGLVRKMGSRWSVGHGEMHHPKLFKTKREAVEAASAWLDAIALRQSVRTYHSETLGSVTIPED